MARLRTSQIMRCGHCDEPVLVPPNRWASFKFCSRSCQASAALQQITARCQTCDKSFTHISARCNTAKYCSRHCYYKAQHLKGSVIVSCAHCGRDFRASPSEKRKFCSRACVSKSHHKVWKPSFTTVRKALNVRGQMLSCESCGYDKHSDILGVHHKDGNRKNNSRRNLEILCPNCHSLRHRKHVPH